MRFFMVRQTTTTTCELQIRIPRTIDLNVKNAQALPPTLKGQKQMKYTLIHS